MKYKIPMNHKIRRLLQQRHHKDVYVDECKDGPTWTARHHRIDAWAMSRSYTPLTMFGYEIKTSRQDFLGDNKWPIYLPMCHQLYFVCPPGLIDKEELPPEVGLLWVTKTGTRLYTKKKAPRREIEIPKNLLIYIIMSRAVIQDEQASDKLEYWRKWLSHKTEAKNIGYEVSRKVNEYVRDAKEKNLATKIIAARYDDFKKKLRANGIDPDSGIWAMERKLDDILVDKDRRMIKQLNSLAAQLSSMAKRLDDAIKSHKD